MRALWIVVLVGCSNHKDKPAPAPAPAAKQTPAPVAPAAPSAACSDRGARLDKRLHALSAATPGFMPAIHDITAPDAAAGKPLDTRGFVIAIDSDGKLFTQGQQLATQRDLYNYLDTINKEASEKFALDGGSLRDASFPLYIWADRNTPAGTVAGVVATAAEAGNHWSIRLLVAGKTPPPAAATLTPEVSAIAAKLPTGEPDATTYLVAQLKTAMGACKPLIMTLATASMEAIPAKEANKLATDVPAGLVKCECKIPNPDVFEWGMDVWFGASAPALAWIEMPKLAKGDKHTLADLGKK